MSENKIVTACVLIIGNEVLSGRTPDANLHWLAEQLTGIGIRLAEARVIPDVEEVIVGTLNECRVKYDYVFTTGGIGPTHDDITAGCVAKAFGTTVERHPEAVRLLEERLGYLLAVKTLAQDTAVARLANFDLLVDEPIRTPLINNVLAERAQGDILMIANDDQIFRGEGWDARIDQEAARFPDRIYCMWFDDGRYGETVCTFPILSRKWVDTIGYIESPLFEHFNCDLWTWQIAVTLGRVHYIGDVLVEHVHPDTGKAEGDATTRRHTKGNRTARDRALRDVRTLPPFGCLAVAGRDRRPGAQLSGRSVIPAAHR